MTGRIRLLAWIYLVMCGIALAVGTVVLIGLLLSRDPARDSALLFVGPLFLAMAVLFFLPGVIGGVGLLRGKAWARAIIITLSFLIIRLAPGGPFDEEQALPPAIKANLEAAYGLDAPLAKQYFRYGGGLLHGDFGPSFKFRDVRVGELIWQGLPVSLLLGACDKGAFAETLAVWAMATDGWSRLSYLDRYPAAKAFALEPQD